MLLFDVIRLAGCKIDSADTKIHLATWNGLDDPYDLFIAGKFEEWQCCQTKQNFKRPNVISLVGVPGVNRWLFAGVYFAKSCDFNSTDKCYYYSLNEIEGCSDLKGRLFVTFPRPGRQSYLNAEKWSDLLTVSELLPKPVSIIDFPGYKSVDISKQQLDVIVSEVSATWKTALSSVSGVYLISDTSIGKLYVGSATGEGGIWQRWCQYSSSAHGGNVELKKIIDSEGIHRAKHFRYSILEIADIHASQKEIVARESHWKRVLVSRHHGLNAN